jgi:hypothetical protein
MRWSNHCLPGRIYEHTGQPNSEIIESVSADRKLENREIKIGTVLGLSLPTHGVERSRLGV